MAQDSSGIMALPTDQAQPAAQNPAVSPENMAVFDQLRQNISPKEFSDELLNTAAQADPQAVAEFKAELEGLDVPPEVLDLLDRLIDEVLANPDNYDEIRQKYIAQGVSEDMLPEQFDPEFFAAINIALNQVRGEPAGPQAFANGGIAELKPIAQALASYGRNGDTMLAHITPAEARMLKKRGGSGTINPVTGLPEYANIFSKIASAGKKFLRSTVGRVIMTVALGFFLGPAAAGLMGVTSAAGVAAVGGFIGSAGSTLLAGGSARDALRAGAIGGLTAGITQGVMGEAGAFEAGSYQGPTTVSGQVERFTGAFSPESAATIPEAPVQQTAPQAPTQQQLPVQQSGETFPVRGGEAPVRPLDKYDMLPESVGNTPMGMQGRVPDKYDMLPESVGNTPMGMQGQQQPPAAAAPSAVPTIQPVAPPVTQAVGTEVGAQQFGLGAPTAGDLTKEIVVTETPSFTEQIESAYKKYLSPSDIEARGIPAAQKAGADAVAAADRTIPRSITGEARAAMLRAEYTKAYNAAMPGPLTKYGPLAAVGLGITGLAGGFQNKPASQSPLMDIMMGGPGSANYLLSQNPYQYYVQNLPGVSYAGGRPRGYADGGVATQQDGGGVGSNAGTGNSGYKPKTLTPQQKTMLEGLLTQAQTTNNFASLNEQVARLGLTEADILANFPAITAEAIKSVVSKGAAFVPQLTMPGGGYYSPFAAFYFAANPDVKQAFETQVKNMTPEDYVRYHWNTHGQKDNRKGFLNYLDPTTTVDSVTGETVTGGTGNDTVTGGGGNEVTPPVSTIPGVAPVTSIGTPAATQVEVASPTLRSTTLPTDARSLAIRGEVNALGPNPSAAQIAALMDQRGIGPAEIASAFNLGLPQVQAQYYNSRNTATLGGYAVNPFTGIRTPVTPNRPTPIGPPNPPVLPPVQPPVQPPGGGTPGGGIPGGGIPGGGTSGGGTPGGGVPGGDNTGTQAPGNLDLDFNAPKLTPIYTPSKPGYASFVALDKSVRGGRLMAYDNYGNALSSVKPTESGYKELNRLLVDPETYKKALQDLHEYQRETNSVPAWTEENWAGQKALFDRLAAEYKPLEREENGQKYLMTTGTDPTKDATRFFGGDLSMARHDIKALMDKSKLDFITASNLLYANPYKKVAQAVVDWDKVMAAPDPAKALMAAYAAIAADPTLSQFAAQAVREDYRGWKDSFGNSIVDPTKGVYQGGVLMPPGSTSVITPPTTSVTAPVKTQKFTDEQVIAAARAGLQAGLTPQEVLNRGAQMGLTQDQLSRGLAALQASGYSGLTAPTAPAPAPAPQPAPTSFVPPTTGGIADLPMGNVTTPTEPVTTAATPTTTPGGIASLPTAPVVTAPVTPTITTPTIPTIPTIPTAPVTTAPTTPEVPSIVPSIVPPLIPVPPAPTYTPPSLMEQEEETQMFNYGGIASLTRGGYPRRNGQISGPGTEKSDSIPAMLSDGEFVMTARAVRGLGNGSRREGAKKMYALMNRLEKNASRA